MGQALFTSDTHFFHANIIQHCQRPYADVAEMNAALIQNWNAKVNDGDTVFHLGDFTFGGEENIAIILKQLRGRKILIRGNHDRPAWKMLVGGFHDVFEGFSMDIDGTKVQMRHVPPKDDAWKKTGALYHLCGHVHEKWARQGDVINVGVDVSGYEPLTLPELLARDE